MFYERGEVISDQFDHQYDEKCRFFSEEQRYSKDLKCLIVGGRGGVCHLGTISKKSPFAVYSYYAGGPANTGEGGVPSGIISSGTIWNHLRKYRTIFDHPRPSLPTRDHLRYFRPFGTSLNIRDHNRFYLFTMCHRLRPSGTILVNL